MSLRLERTVNWLSGQLFFDPKLATDDELRDWQQRVRRQNDRWHVEIAKDRRPKTKAPKSE